MTLLCRVPLVASAQPITSLDRAVAATLRAERAAAGLTQDALAAASGLNRNVYIRLERGERHATLGQLDQIARALPQIAHVTDLVTRIDTRRGEDT